MPILNKYACTDNLDHPWSAAVSPYAPYALLLEDNIFVFFGRQYICRARGFCGFAFLFVTFFLGLSLLLQLSIQGRVVSLLLASNLQMCQYCLPWGAL